MTHRFSSVVATVPLLLAACGASMPPSVHLSDEWPAEAGEFREVTRKWTRRERQISGPDQSGRTFDQTLEVIATFKSPEWRAAYVRLRTERLKLPPSEVSALTERQKADAADHYEVMMMVATYDWRLNELQKGQRSVWRVALVDAAGVEILASDIRRDRRPRSEILAEFPWLGDFAEPYLVRFPRTIDLFRPGANKFSLKVTSSLAGVELVWAEPGATAAR